MSAFFIAFITDGLIFSFGIMLVEIVYYFGTGRAVTGAMLSVMSAIKHVIGNMHKPRSFYHSALLFPVSSSIFGIKIPSGDPEFF